MYAVNAALLYAVRADLLAKAWAVAGERLRQLALGDYRVDELAYHRVLRCADQIKVFALDLVHHVVHLVKAHYAGNNVRTDHERRDVVDESAVDHEIARVGKYGRVQSCNVAAQIVETVSASLSRSVEVYAVQRFHYVNVVGHFKVRNYRLAEALELYVLAVVLADRHVVADYLRYHHHSLLDLAIKLDFLSRKRFEVCAVLLYLCLYLLGFFLLALSHQSADFLAHLVALRSQLVRACLSLAVLFVHSDNFVYQYQLFVLKLFLDVFLYQLGVGPYKLNV